MVSSCWSTPAGARKSLSSPAWGHVLEILVAASSRRELAVTRLVVDRRTNAEIAADLFLSLDGQTHMRNIFPKLGVSSRVEVARIAERAL